MSDEPSDARAAAATLREYLADRDVPCDQCGYNLRGTQDVYCPECGAVIPRPPSEHVVRKQMNPVDLKLWCPECDYVVTGVNAERCPECGGNALTRFSAQKPPFRRGFWWRPRGLPLPLFLIALFGMLLLLPALGRVWVQLGAPRPGRGLALALAGVLFAITPVVIAAVWVGYRRVIRAWPAPDRLAGAGLAFLTGLLGLIAALAIIR